MYERTEDAALTIVLINPQQMREGYSILICLFVYVCVTYDSGGSADLQR